MFALALARPTLAYVAISGISSLQIDYFNSIQATPSQSTLAMPRRSSSNSKKKSQLALYALAFVLTIIVLSIGKSFLNQQAQHFTDLNEMPLADLKESGTSLSGNEYRISGEIADRMILANNRGLLVSIKSETAQGKAGMSLSELVHGAWLVRDLRVAELQVAIDLEEKQDVSTQLPSVDVSEDQARGFLRSLLPNRTELQALQISSLGVELQSERGRFELIDATMTAERRAGKNVYDMTVSNGLINTPWFEGPLKLDSARGRYADQRIYLRELRSQVYQRGMLSLSGELEGEKFELFGTLSDIGVEELIPEDWRKRISGELDAEFKVNSSDDGLMTRGELSLSKGMLTALPVLDRIAAYADTHRFRQLSLTEARLKYISRHGDSQDPKRERLELYDIVLASEGLVRVLGKLTIENGSLDGSFRVGIMPGILAHIPGAETKVFERGEKGLLWSPLRITGTIEDPKEDLSGRLIAAAGERMFEVVPETGKRALKFAHETAIELPQKAVDVGGEILDKGGDVIEEGADIIREGVGGALNLIPGLAQPRDDQ